ncbi:hypothetical protein KR200_008262, partial [Drosophila serrata]
SRIVQINLKRSSHASANLTILLGERDIDIGLIQEPWTRDGQVAGLRIQGYTLLCTNSDGRSRACIVIKNHFNAFLCPNLSTPDLAVARFVAEDGSGVTLSSAYMAHDEPAPPEPAVHLEIVSDLSTDSFLLAFQRFIGRRGCPQTVHCDNATNFVGASRHFQALRERLEEQADAIREFASKSGCEFAFTPPRAPHMGGLWEAQMFWRRWSREYVLGLQIRGKWHHDQENIKEGQLVIVTKDNLPPQQWLLGRIVG